MLWGAAYGLGAVSWFPERWPDWLTGLVFASVPMVISLAVVMPVLGLGFFGVGATGPVAVSGELIRHAVYGVLLGLMYPVFRSKRPVKVLAHTPDEVPAERVASAEA